MFSLSRPIKQLILLALFCLLLLAACGGDEATPTPAPTNPPAPTDTQVPPTVAPAPTNTTVITASTTSTQSAVAPVSPLANPVSPLANPISPLATPLLAPTTTVTSTQSVTPTQTTTTTKTSNVKPAATIAATAIPVSKAGTATVVGHLTSKITGKPLDHAVVRLAEIYCPSDAKKTDTRSKCVWALDGAFSPSTFTDTTGNFAFTNVPPRQYIILIGDMVMKYALVNDEKKEPMMWTVEANKVITTGDFAVDY